jgi:hypothetical protein
MSICITPSRFHQPPNVTISLHRDVPCRFHVSLTNAEPHVPTPGAGPWPRQRIAWPHKGSSRQSNVAISLRRDVPCRFHVSLTNAEPHVPKPGAGPWARQRIAWPHKGSSRRSETATLCESTWPRRIHGNHSNKAAGLLTILFFNRCDFRSRCDKWRLCR